MDAIIPTLIKSVRLQLAAYTDTFRSITSTTGVRREAVAEGVNTGGWPTYRSLDGVPPAPANTGSRPDPLQQANSRPRPPTARLGPDGAPSPSSAGGNRSGSSVRFEPPHPPDLREKTQSLTSHEARKRRRLLCLSGEGNTQQSKQVARGVSLRRAPRREKPNPVPGWGQLRTATRSCPGARTLGKAHVAHPRENPPPQAFIRIRDGSKGHRLGPGDSPAGTLLLEGVARPDARLHSARLRG